MRNRGDWVCLGKPGLTGPAGCRGPGDSPAGGLPEGKLVSRRMPGGHGAGSGCVLGVLCLHVVAMGLLMGFLLGGEILLQKAAPGALCRPVEG